MKGKLYSKEKNFRMLPNMTCICGSGLKFKDCCEKHKYTYKSIGKNYRNEEVIFNHTLTNELYDIISKFLLKNIIDTELSLSKGKEYLSYLYSLSDEGTTQFAKFTPCKKGCSHCCYIYMDCTAIEAELIREYVLKNFTKEKLENLKCKITNNLENVSEFKELIESDRTETMIENYSNKVIPCIFLEDDNTCSIYSVRPFNCRKFISFSSDINCENKETVIKPNISINNIVEYCISHLSMNTTRFKKLRTASEETNEYKAFYQTLQHWFKYGFEQINRNVDSSNQVI